MIWDKYRIMQVVIKLMTRLKSADKRLMMTSTVKVMICVSLLFLETSCSSSGQIDNLFESNSGTLPTADTQPILKIDSSKLPLGVPEGYPYYGEVVVENSTGIESYSLVDSTCRNLTINSSTGVLSGLLDHLDSDACSFKIKVLNQSAEVVSDLISLTFSSPLNISFSAPRVFLQKGGIGSVIDLNISPSPPFSSYLDYTLVSQGGISSDQISGLSGTGTIKISKGSSTNSIQLQVPNSATLTAADYEFFRLQTGSTVSKPAIEILMSASSIPDFVQITGNDMHACAITASGALYCWGDNQNQKIGSGASSSTVTSATLIGSASNWQKIAAGGSYTCGIESGQLYCWGQYSSIASSATPTLIDANTTWQDISVASGHSCGIDAGKLYCWGYAGTGRLGNGATSGTVDTPLRIGVATNWNQVSTGGANSCAIASGSLYCWGGDSAGQVGNGTTTANVSTPYHVGSSTTWQMISVGGGHACGINAGKLYCWGDDGAGQIGNGVTTGNITAPSQIGTATNWQYISAGNSHTCGIESGNLYCWGKDLNEQIGNGAISSTDVVSPLQIGTESGWESAAAGQKHSCAIKSKKIFCWGNDFWGQLGNGIASNSSVLTPTLVSEASSWSNISQSGSHACGIVSGNLFCWGSDLSGQVGNGSAVGTVVGPARVGTMSSWQEVSSGASHTCGIASGNLFCWGSDSKGQIGNGIVIGNIEAPMQITSLSHWQKISAGSTHTCGIESGMLYCWGDDAKGQVGNGVTSGDIIAPEQIGSGANWTSISAGSKYTCGIESGKLFCWGYDLGDPLGNGPGTADVILPVQIGSASNWQHIATSTGGLHTCGIESGKLFCWGYDGSEQLGNGVGSVSADTPLQIGSDTNWQDISAGSSFNCGIETGRLFCWGGGNAASASFATPMQIGSENSWQTVGSGSNVGCGLKSGKLMCWGLGSVLPSLDTSVPSQIIEF